MRRSGWWLALLAGLVWMAGTAEATPRWVAWEGETWPEDSGWQRTTYGGGDQRYLQDGTMVLDGRASSDISDFYSLQRSIVLGPGLTYVMEWKLRVDEEYGFTDPGVCALSQGDGVVVLGYATSSIYSEYEGVWISFAPGVFHDYRLTSTDMHIYALYIDSQLAYEGHFVPSGGQSYVAWGDYARGAASLSVWDYFRFGVVPEPSAGLLLGFAGLAGTVLRTRRTRSKTNGITKVDVGCSVRSEKPAWLTRSA
jgi:hypothetical protein